MAGELQIAHSESGVTLYAQLRSRVGTIWNTVGAAFEAYVTANIADYDIALTEQGTASRYYAGTMPAAVEGVYFLTVLKRAGGAPAESDEYVGAGEAYWSGTVLYFFANGGNFTSTVAGRIDAAISSRAVAGDAMDLVADAVDAASVAASGVTEIQAGLATAAALATVQADTDDIQTRLPAALVSGRIDASVGAMAAGTITAAAVATGAIDADALATDAVDEISAAVWALALETGFSASRIMRIIAAASAGKASGGPGSPVFRNVGDTLDQVTGTADASGNRSAASYGA